MFYSFIYYLFICLFQLATRRVWNATVKEKTIVYHVTEEQSWFREHVTCLARQENTEHTMDIAKVRVRNRQYDIPHKCNDINSCLRHPVFACSCPPSPFLFVFSPLLICSSSSLSLVPVRPFYPSFLFAPFSSCLSTLLVFTCIYYLSFPLPLTYLLTSHYFL